MKQCTQNILQIQVPLIPQLFISGLHPDNLKLKKNQRIFVDLSVLMAKRVNSSHGKTPGDQVSAGGCLSDP